MKRKQKSNVNKTQEIFEKIVSNMQNIVNSGEYEEFLKFQKNFMNYSFNNLVLIFSQFPKATMVAGKKKWETMKREIITDAQKIFIIAPIPQKYQKKTTELVDGEEIEKIKTIEFNRYRYVYVYDISQTTGEPIPMENKTLDTNNMVEFYEKLKSFSNFPIYEKNISTGAEGYYDTNKNEIIIEESLSIDSKTAVLLHELSHAIYDDFDYKTDRNLSEIFVESIAYIVANYFGLDTSYCSFNYITKWAKGDVKNVIDLGNKIIKCSNKFIKELENFKIQEENLVA